MNPLLVLLLVAGSVVAPPPQRAQQQAQQAAAQEQQQQQEGQQQAPPPPPAQEDGTKSGYELAYSKYLEEVVKILESDPKFTEKLKGMKEEDIKAGKIADHIDILEDHVFDKLHKAKLDEVERLRQQIELQIKQDGGAHNVKMPEHLDAEKWEKFGAEDLRLLIKKAVGDMEQIDKERKEGFKDYEMKKKAEEDHKLAMMNEEERKREQHDEEERIKRHNEHEKLKHPASRDQLEEVWEEKDHMDKDAFDPRTFFALHDLNGDGYWNDQELESLFQIELEKMYNDTNPDDDPRERMEEMYRMREHVTNQMDKNRDRHISLDEFLQDTEAQTPNKDDGWKDLGQQLEDNQLYTEEELKKFEEEYAKEQGWGDHAYETTTAPARTTHQQPIQPQQVNHGVNNQQPPVPQQVQPQPRMVHPAQPAAAAQAQQPAQAGQVPPDHHSQPIVESPKDPTFGI